jgi:hypothetical protein
MVADSAPPEQVTAMVTTRRELENVTFAVAAGPRSTWLAANPCCGLHDTR